MNVNDAMVIHMTEPSAYIIAIIYWKQLNITLVVDNV